MDVVLITIPWICKTVISITICFFPKWCEDNKIIHIIN